MGHDNTRKPVFSGKEAKRLGFSTLAVHGGEPRPKLGNSLATPIVQTAIIRFALSSPDPAARSFVAAARKKDPELVKDLEEELATEK